MKRIFACQSMSLLHHLKFNRPFWRVLGGSFLVAGTSIGAGMISLPVVTAQGGIAFTLTTFVLIWFLMTTSALLMLEASLYFPEETNLISMATRTLGKGGKWLIWFCYVLFLYSIMAAYTSSGSHMVFDGLRQSTMPFVHTHVSFMYVSLFALVVYGGAKWVDYLNRFFMIGLCLAYVFLTFVITPHMNFSLPMQVAPLSLLAAMPIIVTSFGFHLLIPSLKSYLHNHVKMLRFAIILGSFLPLLVYSLWVILIQYTLPQDELFKIKAFGEPIVPLTQALWMVTQNTHVAIATKLFSFFAVVTSFIGVSLGLFDFFADGLRIKKDNKGKILLTLLTFIPPLFFVFFYPHGFIIALGFAGIFASILLVLYPALMVYVGRYRLKIKNHYQVWGGKWVLWMIILFGVMVILIELFEQLGYLP